MSNSIESIHINQMLFKDFMKMFGIFDDNETVIKLIQQNSYVIKLNRECGFEKYDVYIKDVCVGHISHNFCGYFSFHSNNTNYDSFDSCDDDLYDYGR